MRKKIANKLISDASLNEQRFAILKTFLLVNNFDDVINKQASENVVRRLLLQACIARALKKVVPENIENFIYDAVFKIATGKDANMAFLLKHGHKNKNTRVKEMEVALAVWKLIEIDNQKTIVAFKEIGKTHNLAEETVRKYYKNHKNTIKKAYAEINPDH